ncbi:hypothetical protein BGZ58_002912 [Dissophora ornata]|nr:hypothetical protein BGZ58_002912 [Dissophora ornata]
MKILRIENFRTIFKIGRCRAKQALEDLPGYDTQQDAFEKSVKEMEHLGRKAEMTIARTTMNYNFRKRYFCPYYDGHSPAKAFGVGSAW